MMRVMYDAVYPANIPKNAAIVASYSDNRTIPANYSQLASLFPTARHISISTQGGDADAIDFEPGNWGYPDANNGIKWVNRQRARGNAFPWFYCNMLADWLRLQNAFHNAGVVQPVWWISNYTITMLPPGAGLLQFTDNPGRGYDTSILADYIPGFDVAPHPSPDPLEDPMYDLMVSVSDGPGIYVVSHDLTTRMHVATPADVTALLATGLYKQCSMSTASMSQIPLVKSS